MSISQHVERCIANQQTFKALNAFIALKPDIYASKRAATVADDRLSRGQARSAIDGHIIAIKDNICTTDLPTTCASGILNGFMSPYSATVVEKLQAAGATIAGKTNLDEFGMGSHSTFSRFGPVHNMNVEACSLLSAGGSSGGSAVAVATRQCFAALGTDTGGSVRLPASYTAVVGFKPSYGMVSRYGVIAYANSLDTVGILATTSGIAKQVFDVINGFDPQDPTSLPSSIRSRIQDQLRSRDIKWPFRIGVPLDYNIKELDPKIRKTWLQTLQHLQSQGHSIHTVALPNTKAALSAYYIIAPAEASSNLAKYDGVRYGQPATSNTYSTNVLYATARGEGLGEEVKRRILLGAYSLSASAIDNYFIQAQKIRRLVQKDFDNVFAFSNPLLSRDQPTSPSIGVDVILSPTAPSFPPNLADISNRSPTDTYSDDVLTVPASLAGLPAISIPFPIEDNQDQESKGIPTTVGLQITGQFGDEEMVFRVAEALEQWGVVSPSVYSSVV